VHIRFFSSRCLLPLVLAAWLAFPALAQNATPGATTQDSKAQPDGKDAKDAQKKAREAQRRRLQELQGPYKKWLNEDVRWIITPEEEAAFKQLSTDDERDQFIEQFWLRRNPNPESLENDFKEEHYRRIAYANEHFSAGLQGWRTDRGHIYIVWGPADEIDSHPTGGMYQRSAEEGGGSTSTYPFERWRYRRLEGIGNEINIEFVDTCSCNEYHIAVDASEKDALLNTPGGGLSMYEQMGLGSQVNRVTGGNSGNPFSSQSDRFEKLERIAKLTAPPPIKFKDLQEDVSHRVTYNLVPFDVRVDYVRVTGDTVLTPVTIQVRNKDLTFSGKQGIQRASLNIFGRATTMTGRVVQTFEDTVAVDVPNELLSKTVEQYSVDWQALTLRPGRYRLDVVVKDVNGDRKGSWSRGLMVPAYSEDKLASSTLIVADLLEKVSIKSSGSGRFVIGNTRIRPLVEPVNGRPVTFKRGQSLNLWMQVYNLAFDEKTKKPSATIQYQIVNLQTNQPVEQIVEKTESMGTVGEQLTLSKTLALKKFDPGLYRLQIKVDDNVSKQSISPSARFMVE